MRQELVGNRYFKENLCRLSFVSVDRGQSYLPDTGLPISQRCTTEVQRYRDWKRCTAEVQRLEKVQHKRYKRYRDGSWRNRGRHKFGLKTAQQWQRSTLKPCRVDADVLITVATTTKTYIVTN